MVAVPSSANLLLFLQQVTGEYLDPAALHAPAEEGLVPILDEVMLCFWAAPVAVSLQNLLLDHAVDSAAIDTSALQSIDPNYSRLWGPMFNKWKAGWL
jgi:hypothetical protein